MTNWEHYKDDEEFQKICACGRFGVDEDTNIVSVCDDGEFDCWECKFYGKYRHCHTARKQWLDEEYQEQKEPEVDWSKVEVDTPIFVRDYMSAGWTKRHFSRYEYGKVYAWMDGKTSHTSSNLQLDTKSWKFAKLAEVNKDD